MPYTFGIKILNRGPDQGVIGSIWPPPSIEASDSSKQFIVPKLVHTWNNQTNINRSNQIENTCLLTTFKTCLRHGGTHEPHQSATWPTRRMINNKVMKPILNPDQNRRNGPQTPQSLWKRIKCYQERITRPARWRETAQEQVKIDR